MTDASQMSDEQPGVDGTPAWAYSEDGYCVACGNGRWKHHMPECELRDALDAVAGVDAELAKMRDALGAAGHGWRVAQDAADRAVAEHRQEVDRLNDDLRRMGVEREKLRQRMADDKEHAIRRIRAELSPTALWEGDVWLLAEDLPLDQPSGTRVRVIVQDVA